MKGRPKSAFELAERAAAGESFFPLLREFLDNWYSSPGKPEIVREEPESIPERRCHAYLVGACRQLCVEYDLEAPGWCRGIRWRLERPWFPCGLSSLRPWLIYSSPPAFKMLNIFPGKNPLFRPLKLMDGGFHGSRYMPEGIQAS